MKSVLISIQPQWCEKIFSGEKTIEVRRNRPKLEPPFTVYVYQTKIKFKVKNWQENFQSIVFTPNGGVEEGNGKVIGSFVCDKIDEYEANERGWYIYPQDETCLLCDEIAHYGKGKPLYGWHITAPKLFDKPKELGEFRKVCLNGKCSDCIYEECKITRPPQSWQYVDELQ